MIAFVPLLVTGLTALFATMILELASRKTAALVAVGALVVQLVAVVVAVAVLQPSDPCSDDPNDRAALALVLGSAALGGVAFGGTLAATRRHPGSAAVAFVAAALPYVSYVVIYAPGGLGC